MWNQAEENSVDPGQEWDSSALVDEIYMRMLVYNTLYRWFKWMMTVLKSNLISSISTIVKQNQWISPGQSHSKSPPKTTMSWLSRSSLGSRWRNTGRQCPANNYSTQHAQTTKYMRSCTCPPINSSTKWGIISSPCSSCWKSWTKTKLFMRRWRWWG